MKENHIVHFSFSPNLISLLGEQLIHDKKIALSELVKNSYDADASIVKINITDSSIEIEDDGCGMDRETICNIWMQPGVSHKKESVENNKLSTKYKRLPIGEKGVGRLGCHKLGNKIKLETKSKNQRAISLEIDWRKLEQAKKFDEVPIQVKEIEKDTIGTKIIITDLKETWNDKEIKQSANELIAILSPFKKVENFNIEFSKNGSLFPSSLREELDKVIQNALFRFNIAVKNGLIKKFKYEFKPWKGLEKVEPRLIDLKEDKNLLEKILGHKSKYLSFEKELENISSKCIGELNFQGLIYDYDNPLWLQQTQLSKEDKNLIKNYTKTNGGIRVYKDNLRVFNYGEPGNDILDLDLKRVNLPARKISSNQILATIHLDRKSSFDLIEKTNREGFINNKALDVTKGMLEELINFINVLRLDDKTKLMKTYLRTSHNRVGIEDKFLAMKGVIEKSNLDSDSKKNITTELEQVSEDFIRTKELLLNSSNSGIRLAQVVHELEKVVYNLETKVKNKAWEEVEKIIPYLSQVIKNYQDILKVDKKSKKVNLSSLIEKALFNVKARLEYHNIQLVEDTDKHIEAVVKSSLIMGALNNLFDNAIYWLNYYNIEDKKILIKLYEKNNQIYLLIADNGKGFNISFESAIAPFITGRVDESSMGLGLHIIDNIISAHGGFLLLGNYEEENLDNSFKYGAILKIILKGK